MFRKADRATGVSTIVKNMRQGARANVDKEVTFKLPPESQPSAFVFSATGGKTPFDKSTITKMLQKVRAARAERTGKEEQISSHTERTSMCYWLDQVMKVNHTVLLWLWIGCQSKKSVFIEHTYQKGCASTAFQSFSGSSQR